MLTDTKRRFQSLPGLQATDTRRLATAGGPDARLPLPNFSRLDGSDALDAMAQQWTLADAADHALLRLVVCAALATLLLALASSL